MVGCVLSLRCTREQVDFLISQSELNVRNRCNFRAQCFRPGARCFNEQVDVATTAAIIGSGPEEPDPRVIAEVLFYR